MIDEMLKVMKALKADFKNMLKDETIPLETRMEWFANYGEHFLDVDVYSQVEFLEIEMSGYLDRGYTEEDIPRIKELLDNGSYMVV